MAMIQILERRCNWAVLPKFVSSPNVALIPVPRIALQGREGVNETKKFPAQHRCNREKENSMNENL